MAKSILKDFYYGNIVPTERQMVNGSEIKRAAQELVAAENQLRTILQPEAIPLMERYGKAYATLNAITDAENYIDGFKTGARFVMEILDDSHENLKPIRSQ